ncbi:hypothetical protein NQ317_008694 [Molorchus minor]|uniref:Uncharacterized protein n=1 Tax=Molorchus minor TaxID=1323400 RepID=A0ABQ9K108_9CUCU|nr:hypothetical protein NQ317_008694 [Molorchus minor]
MEEQVTIADHHEAVASPRSAGREDLHRQHGTLVGLLPVPHPILIRKYQANSGTTTWFRTYMWGVIYLRNVDPPIWYDTDVKLFEIQRI